MLFLRNQHVSLSCLAAMWSQYDRQLVAAMIAATDKISVNAILAELEKNGGKSQVWLNSSTNSSSEYVREELTGAAKGFVKVQTDMSSAAAHGYVVTMLHWRAHDPRALPKSDKPEDSYFYIVATDGEDMLARFEQRLNLAIPWPIGAEWATPLLAAGLDRRLVRRLKTVRAKEYTGAGFAEGFRIELNTEAWGDVLSDLLRSGMIST